MTVPSPPRPDEIVEALFTDVLIPPDGYSYYLQDDQLLFPVFGQDRWRLLLRKGDTLIPVFIEGAFILKLTKALHAMQRELNAAVSDDIPEPVQHGSSIQ